MGVDDDGGQNGGKGTATTASKRGTKTSTSTTSQTPIVKPIPNYDLFMDMGELCTMFLIMAGQLSMDMNEIYSYIDELYKDDDGIGGGNGDGEGNDQGMGNGDQLSNNNKKGSTSSNNNNTNKHFRDPTKPISLSQFQLNGTMKPPQHQQHNNNPNLTSNNNQQSTQTPNSKPSNPTQTPTSTLPSLTQIPGYKLYQQLIQIPPYQLYLDPSLLSQLTMGQSTQYEFVPPPSSLMSGKKGKDKRNDGKGGNKGNDDDVDNQNDDHNDQNDDDDNTILLPHTITPLAPIKSTHSPITTTTIQTSNLVKQGDKYGDYDGLCGFVDYLNITRSAGLWIDLNYDLYE